MERSSAETSTVGCGEITTEGNRRPSTGGVEDSASFRSGGLLTWLLLSWGSIDRSVFLYSCQWGRQRLVEYAPLSLVG